MGLSKYVSGGFCPSVRLPAWRIPCQDVAWATAGYVTCLLQFIAQWSLYVPHSGHYMYRQFNIQQFYVLPTQLYLCVLCGSENKQPLFHCTALTGWFA